MTIYLLDVNVLVALLWRSHSQHTQVQQWFGHAGSRAWATCPFTESAFVRILSNPAFSDHAVTPSEARQALEANVQHRGHHFWEDDIPFPVAVRKFQDRIIGHRQVTDAYLLGLALHNKGTLATLDEGISALLPEDDPEQSRVLVIPRDDPGVRRR